MKRFTNTKPAAHDPAARDFPRIKNRARRDAKKTIFKQKKVRKGNFRGEI